MDQAKSRQTHLVNDVTGQHPTTVWAVITPTTVQEVTQALARSDGPVSIGGARYSMGGQIASPDSVHIDMRQLNQVVSFSPVDRTIRVQAGMRWREVLRFLDPHDLSVKVMPTYANFTVGGSISVNAHGPYMGQAPIVHTVRALKVAMADGALIDCSRTRNADIFKAVIGSYGSIGVIVEAELDLSANRPLKRVVRRLSLRDYTEQFQLRSLVEQKAVIHYGELRAPGFARVRSVTWVESDEAVKEPGRLQVPGQAFSLPGLLAAAISDNWFARVQRDFISEPLSDLSTKIHWRNLEASYDVGDQFGALAGTASLQEYFVPVASFESFVARLRRTLHRHRVGSVSISIRHASADNESLMAWAHGETLCVMLHHRLRAKGGGRDQIAVWTRELIDAALAEGGSYYLPYEVLATRKQFLTAYPRALDLFALKQRLDPGFRLRNALWNHYYDESLVPSRQQSLDFGAAFSLPLVDVAQTNQLMAATTGYELPSAPKARRASDKHVSEQATDHAANRAADQTADRAADQEADHAADQQEARGNGTSEQAYANADVRRSDFQQVISEPTKHDGLYRFLQNIYREYPEDRFHALIKQLVDRHGCSDEAIYRNLLRELPAIRPTAAQLMYSWPALRRHKIEVAQQTVAMLGSKQSVTGYMEIGSNGRYLQALRRHVRVRGQVFMVDQSSPGYSLSNIVERGSPLARGSHVSLRSWLPIMSPRLSDESLDLITCFVGLHNCPPEHLETFLFSVVRLLRPGGMFVLRDYDVPSAEKRVFVSVTRAVVNAGTGMTWQDNIGEVRNFASLSYWSEYLESYGLKDTGMHMPQMDDPSDNTLMGFVKPA